MDTDEHGFNISLHSFWVDTPPLGASKFNLATVWYPAACGGELHSEYPCSSVSIRGLL